MLDRPYRGLAQKDLTEKWSDFDRSMVIDYFRRMRDLGRQANEREATGDHAAAVGLWRQVYGDAFPTASVSLEQSLTNVTRQGGGVSSAGNLTRSSAVPGAHGPGRPWRSR